MVMRFGTWNVRISEKKEERIFEEESTILLNLYGHNGSKMMEKAM
jgi:hypothetical protein